jgi:DNA mismatch endonuclease, patch repair protein
MYDLWICQNGSAISFNKRRQMDRVNKTKRSEIMSKIRSKNTHSTELRFRAFLIRGGFRGWTLNQKLKGSPDCVFVREKIAIFIDGCFWHGCPKCCRMPKSNTDYWEAKIKRNIQRDREVTVELKNNGWQVLRYWEHDVKECPSTIMKEVRGKLNKKNT